MQSKIPSPSETSSAISPVVLHWCGLRAYNTIGRFSSLACATECIHRLAATGFTLASISTAALFGDERIDALVGVHSDDVRDADRASAVMRAANARVCCF
jgi:hypothetical protein